MTETKRTADRRAQHVALGGFALQSAACAVVIWFSLWQDSHALAALARFLFAGVPIWLVLYLILNQVRRVGLEAMETEELRRAQESGAGQALFELDEEALLLEHSRLRWMVRWLLPCCTIVVSFILLVGHFTLWSPGGRSRRTRSRLRRARGCPCGRPRQSLHRCARPARGGARCRRRPAPRSGPCGCRRP